MWAEAGFDPDSFWNQTPRRLDAILTGYVQRRRIEAEQAISTAWHTEAFARVKRLPTLDKALGRKPPPPKDQSNDELLAAMRTWAAMSANGEQAQ